MLRTRPLGWCVLTICLAHTAAVRAVDHAQSAPDVEESTWYGWQTLTLDGIMLATLPVVGLAGVGIYVLGAPIVHAIHGNGAAAVASFGLRVLPFGIGLLSQPACDDSLLLDSCHMMFGMIALVASIVPIVLDPVLFSYESKPDRRAAYVQPWLDATSGGLALRRTF